MGVFSVWISGPDRFYHKPKDNTGLKSEAAFETKNQGTSRNFESMETDENESSNLDANIQRKRKKQQQKEEPKSSKHHKKNKSEDRSDHTSGKKDAQKKTESKNKNKSSSKNSSAKKKRTEEEKVLYCICREEASKRFMM